MTKEDSKVQYLGFSFDGTKVNIRRNSIGRYISKLNKAAYAIAGGCKKNGDLPSDSYIRRRLFEGYTLMREEKTNFMTYALRAEDIMAEAKFDVSKIESFRKKHLNTVSNLSKKVSKKFNKQ